MAGSGVVGGDPPGPAARGRGQPHVVIGDERHVVAMDMGETQVTG
jgi:hypothetical protein